jgi:hypothetical protein
MRVSSARAAARGVRAQEDARQMSLDVYTARISSRDPDRLDITRKSGKGDALAFAPSWAILGPALESLRRAQAAGGKLGGQMALDAWRRYVRAYRDEMRASYRLERAAWERLLGRRRVVLCCYCADPCRCHRTLLGRFILPKLGASFCGEVLP